MYHPAIPCTFYCLSYNSCQWTLHIYVFLSIPSQLFQVSASYLYYHRLWDIIATLRPQFFCVLWLIVLFSFFFLLSISLSSFSASPLSYIFSESFLRLSHFLINRFQSSIIRQLPPDVMSTIFEFCLLDITDHQILLFSSYAAMKKKYGNLFTPLLLGAICSYWRDVAWSTPSPSSGLQYWFMIQANIICI